MVEMKFRGYLEFDKVWHVTCLKPFIMASGFSRAEAIERMERQILKYLQRACTDRRWKYMMRQKAPPDIWLRYVFLRISDVTRREKRTVRFYV